MTIKQQVTMALTVYAGNKVFTLNEFYAYFAGNDSKYTKKQLSKALCNLSHVRVLGNGKYTVKGRKV